MKTNLLKMSTCSLKAFFLFFIFHFSFFIAFGQTPQKFTYQAVIRDASNHVLANQAVGMKISILQGSESGPVVYTERHAPTTNVNGLISVIVGDGGNKVGNIATIDWGANIYFLKSETDLEGGENYTITITNQMLSVPYALHANENDPTWYGNANDFDAIGRSGNVGIGTIAPTAKLDIDGQIRIRGGNPETGKVLVTNGEGTAEWQHLAFVSGTGTTNYVSKWISETSQSSSQIFDNGINVGIGTSSPAQQLEITGNMRIPITINSSTGIIYKSNKRFLHNFQAENTNGNNTFLGIDAGNFTMSGTTQMDASNNTGIGFGVLQFNQDGYMNTAIGSLALQRNTNGTMNCAVGSFSLNLNSTGYKNTAIGHSSLINNTLGFVNTAIGSNALAFNTTASENVAIGGHSLEQLSFTSAPLISWQSCNTAVGTYSLMNLNATTINDGKNNTAVGYSAGEGVYGQTNGYNNIFLGYRAGANITSGTNNIVLGYSIDLPYPNASHQMILGSPQTLYGDLGNSRIGMGTISPTQKLEVKDGNVLLSNSSIAGEMRFAEPSASGINYTALKAQTQSADITYTLPASAGTNGQILSTNSTGVLSWINPNAGNITGSGFPGLIAFFSGGSESIASSSNLFWDNTNSRLGIGTLTPGQQLELTGAMQLPLTTSNITGVIYKGTSPFMHNFKPTGCVGNNVFLGEFAGNFTMSGSAVLNASNNVGLGFYALNSLSTGYDNTAIGSEALKVNSSGYENTAVGRYSMTGNTTGASNTVIGYQSLYENKTGNNNTTVGKGSMQKNISASENIAIGESALFALNYSNNQNSWISANTAVGNGALRNFNATSVNNSIHNTAVGYRAGYGIYGSTTGSKNIFLGYQAGDNITTGSNNIVLGYDQDLPNEAGNFQMVLGNSTTLYGDLANNRIGIGTTSPQEKLHIAATGDARIRISASISSLAEINFYKADSYVGAIGSSNANNYVFIYQNGNVIFKNGRIGIQSVINPTYAIDLPNSSTVGTGSGRAYAWATYSDGRLKTDRKDISYGLYEIMQLKPLSYFHHESVIQDGRILIKKEGKEDFGFIAQDLQKIIPELVNKPEDEQSDLWSVNYEKLVPILTKAIQEQQQQIEKQEQEILLLKVQMQELQKAILNK